ncbi:MAG: adenylate/guanylate cyclase domain-containing protein, partial [Parafannyhessea sp.]|uniref:adenylate/guanylate cyclase domain-containing protein n=1 Tax=Parafannyhessea sp. TaxID=2847324 RepID=UPI003F058FE9
CGPAVVGNIGCEFRKDYTAIGDTVNTAARLEANAPRGQIYISRTLYERLEGRVLVEEVGPLALKGKANAVDVLRVVGLADDGER